MAEPRMTGRSSSAAASAIARAELREDSATRIRPDRDDRLIGSIKDWRPKNGRYATLAEDSMLIERLNLKSRSVESLRSLREKANQVRRASPDDYPTLVWWHTITGLIDHYLERKGAIPSDPLRRSTT